MADELKDFLAAFGVFDQEETQAVIDSMEIARYAKGTSASSGRDHIPMLLYYERMHSQVSVAGRSRKSCL